MKLVTAAEMRELDRRAIEEVGIPSLVLMENAGRSTYQILRREFPDPDGEVAILAGRGNNGGDGFVVARYLAQAGEPVTVFLLGRRDQVRGDAMVNLDILAHHGVEVLEVTEESHLNPMLHRLARAGLIVDALLGTGLDKPVQGLLAALIDKVNHLRPPVLAVDLPTGLSADTGEVLGAAMQAEVTVTYGWPKIGQILPPGRDYVGRLWRVDLSIPPDLAREAPLELAEARELRELIPIRPFGSHKGTFGHLFVLAGSEGKTGAAALASLGGLRAGAGLVTLGIAASLNDIMEVKLTEAMTLPLPEAEGARALGLKALEPILAFAAGCDRPGPRAGAGDPPGDPGTGAAPGERAAATPGGGRRRGQRPGRGPRLSGAGRRAPPPHPAPRGDGPPVGGLHSGGAGPAPGGGPGDRRQIRGRRGPEGGPDAGGGPRRPDQPQPHRQPGPGQRRHRRRPHRPHRRLSGPEAGTLGRGPPGGLPARAQRRLFRRPIRSPQPGGRRFNRVVPRGSGCLHPGLHPPLRGRYMLAARDIMTKEVITVSPETLVSDLAQTLAGKNIGGVPVVTADGRLVGIVTQSDLVERVQELKLPPAINILDLHVYLQIPSHLFRKVEKMLGATVADVMSPKPADRVAGDAGAPDRRPDGRAEGAHPAGAGAGEDCGDYRQDGPGPGRGPGGGVGAVLEPPYCSTPTLTLPPQGGGKKASMANLYGRKRIELSLARVCPWVRDSQSRRDQGPGGEAGGLAAFRGHHRLER